MRMAWVHDEEDHPLSERGIEQRNHALLRRYREFRRGADAVAAAWRAHPEVIAVSLIGSVARAPWKEVPRFGPYADNNPSRIHSNHGYAYRTRVKGHRSTNNAHCAGDGPRAATHRHNARPSGF